jgi:hypothetical protein
MLHITPVTGDYKDEVNLFIDLMKENIKNCKGIFKKFIFRWSLYLRVSDSLYCNRASVQSDLPVS